jgi:hypothetical protein
MGYLFGGRQLREPASCDSMSTSPHGGLDVHFRSQAKLTCRFGPKSESLSRKVKELEP